MDPLSIQAKLDELAARIGHSLSIDAPDGRLISYSVQDSQADAPRIAAILSRRVAPEIQHWQNRHGIAEATSPVRVPHNADLGMAARVCIPLRSGVALLGYLWVLEGDEALDDTALSAAAAAAGGLARLLQDHDDLDGLVRRFLEDGETATRDALAATMPSLLGAHLEVCVAIPTGEALPAADFQRLTTSLTPALSSSPAYVGSFVTATHAVVMLRHPAPLDPLDLFGEAFTLGISDPVPFEPAAARTAYDHARAAAEVAALDPLLPRILPWSSVGPYRLLLGEPDPVLTPLDQAGGSAQMLTHTLETYLDFGCDIQRTAARLHLHRTTLYYRLGRISEVLGMDLNDGMVRLHLHLALKTRRLNSRS